MMRPHCIPKGYCAVLNTSMWMSVNSVRVIIFTHTHTHIYIYNVSYYFIDLIYKLELCMHKMVAVYITD